ncbi:MAG: MBL fold metallo-hydrolase [Burkholderiaceae bacterium]|nr:MBL fold metallo-hydrolase [Burkholderiaceae bacterium]
MESTSEFSTPLGQGIWAIDTGYQRANFDAAYLIVEQGRAAFIDCGTSHSVPRLLATLDATGVSRDAVDWVIPTHVHLDHAGGAGALMEALPSARMVVHPRGARHLINPTVLLAGARAVYGEEEVQRAYGTVVPVEASRVTESAEGLVIHLADRPLKFFDTPGHARHHHCIWDERSRGFFTGDTFGLSYREFDTPAGIWLLPTTTPVQFDPVALRMSIERLLAEQPSCMYLTHYGRVPVIGTAQVTDVARLGRDLLDQVDEVVALGRHAADLMLPAEKRHGVLRDGLTALYLQRVQRLGCTLQRQQILDLLEMDIELNAQGVGVWLDAKR